MKFNVQLIFNYIPNVFIFLPYLTIFNQKGHILSTIIKVFYVTEELPFCNVSINKSIIKRLKNIDLLPELPFHDQLNIIKTDQAFSRYAMSYKVEIVDEKDLIVQLEASRLSIKGLFNDLLNETKDFKYQITVDVLLK